MRSKVLLFLLLLLTSCVSMEDDEYGLGTVNKLSVDEYIPLKNIEKEMLIVNKPIIINNLGFDKKKQVYNTMFDELYFDENVDKRIEELLINNLSQYNIIVGESNIDIEITIESLFVKLVKKSIFNIKQENRTVFNIVVKRENNIIINKEYTKKNRRGNMIINDFERQYNDIIICFDLFIHDLIEINNKNIIGT